MTSKEIRDILLKERNEEKLTQVFKEVYETQFKHYHIVSIIDIIMNYIALNQYLVEVQDLKKVNKDKLFNEAFELIKNSIIDWSDLNTNHQSKANYKEKLLKTKSSIEEKIKVLIALNDQIDLYENLLEKHIEDKDNLSFDDEELAKDIVNFAFKDKDKLIIDSKMKELLKILPVRITKSKWDDYINNSLSVYYGGYKKDLEDYIRSIKNTVNPESVDGYFDINIAGVEVINELKDVDYNSLTEVEAKKHTKKLDELSKSIEIIFDICNSLTEIINKLIILYIGPTYTIEEVFALEPKLSKATAIIDYIKVNEIIREEDILEYLSGLEGVGESWLMSINSLDGIINMIQKEKAQLLDELGLKNIYNEISIASMLLSTSLFASINDILDDRGPQVDKSILTKTITELIDWMNSNLHSLPREVRRIKINQLMYMLPVAFKTPQEFYDYVLQSLVSCSNKNERTIVYKKYKDIRSDYM